MSATLQLNATFSPTLSFQLYAQPFTFTGPIAASRSCRRARRSRSTRTDATTTPPSRRGAGDTVCNTGPTECFRVDPDGRGRRRRSGCTTGLPHALAQRQGGVALEYRPGPLSFSPGRTVARTTSLTTRASTSDVTWAASCSRPAHQRAAGEVQLLAQLVASALTSPVARDAVSHARPRASSARMSPVPARASATQTSCPFPGSRRLSVVRVTTRNNPCSVRPYAAGRGMEVARPEPSVVAQPSSRAQAPRTVCRRATMSAAGGR